MIKLRKRNLNDPRDRLSLKRLRHKLQLTQAQLAYGLGVTTQSVSNWETARELPHESMQAILRRLGAVNESTAHTALRADQWSRTLQLLFQGKP